MGNQVYANNMEVSCKAADGKTICAFPDVVFTPPQTPATPPGVPIPYPNTGMASDCTDGSKTVQVSGQEVMLKDKSYFKKSTGDEAGSAPKKGLINSKQGGKVYFVAWSMDVKIEGENVVRHMDMTTGNHASPQANAATPWPHIDEATMAAGGGDCADDIKKEKTACEKFEPYGDRDACAELKSDLPYQPTGRLAKSGKPNTAAQADQLADTAAPHDCVNARRCNLSPYKTSKSNCCSPQTGHHLVEASSFLEHRETSPTELAPFVSNQLSPGRTEAYHENKAPCVCADGTSNVGGTHGAMHTLQSIAAAKTGKNMDVGGGQMEKVQTYRQAKQAGVEAMQEVFPYSYCDPKCIEAQLDDYHNRCGINDDTQVKAVQCGDVSPEGAERIRNEVAARYSELLLSKMG